MKMECNRLMVWCLVNLKKVVHAVRLWSIFLPAPYGAFASFVSLRSQIRKVVLRDSQGQALKVSGTASNPVR